ncbi:MAG TPA: choice-of-anchor J domain-containing protein, partial [Chitinophagaceae bacterium]
PTCTSIQDLNGNSGSVPNSGGGGWFTFSGADATTYISPTRTIRYLYDATNPARPADDWFFIQGLNLTAGTSYRLKFYYKGSDGPIWFERLEVKYGTAALASAMTSGTLFTDNNIVTNLASAFTEGKVDFTPASTGVYYIGFHCTSLADQAFLYLEDISVDVTPLCDVPTAVSVVSTTPTSASVYFTAPGNNFIVEYGAVGFTPGTGATPGVGGTIVTGTASPINVPGLTASTTYDFYIRQECAGPLYSNNVKVTGTTLCPATNIPYVQNFETATVPGLPTCTSIQDLNGNSGSVPNSGGGGWFTFAGTSTQTYVSPTRVIRYLYDAANASRPADDWFFIQGLNLTAGTTYRVRFFYKGSDGPTWTERMEVKYGTSASAAGMTNTIFTNNNINSALADPWATGTADFTPASTGVYYIGFHATSLADQAFLYLDDISVRLAPAVDVGISSITTPNVNCPVNNVFIQAEIKNYNTTPVNFATTPVNVNARIVGPTTTNLPTTLINAGTLAPNETMNIYLGTAYNFIAGTHEIIINTTTPLDPELLNDTLRKTVIVNANPATPVITPASAQICLGSTVQLSTQFTPPAAPVVHPTVTSGTISIPIPDNSPAGASHTLSVSGIPANATITAMSVTLNATHLWNSDLVFSLKAPNGNVLNLVNERGGTGDNFTNCIISSTSTNPLPAGDATPVTGTFAADGATLTGPTGFATTVNSFAGLFSVPNGNWTLAAADIEALISGTLTGWSISITYQVLTPTITWTPVTGLYTNAAATTAYVANADAYSVYAKPTETTTYTVKATTFAGCSSSATATVTVNPNPVVTIGTIPDTVCISDQIIPLVGNPVGGTWSGVGVSGNNFIPPTTAVGNYLLTYSYTSQAGCTVSATKRIWVKDCPDRIILLRDNALILFPNPTDDGRFNIRINSVLYNNLVMRVYTSHGAIVKTQRLTGLVYGRVVPIDLSALPGGTYVVEFAHENAGPRTAEKSFKVIIGH